MSGIGGVAGETIAGKYRLERILGAGGMGVVMAARHLELDQTVSLKFLLPKVAEEPRAVARFLREARASARLRSAHVCRVLDVARQEDGTPYLVMEYLDGVDLEREVARRGRLAIDRAVDLILQACDALAEAHALGIVHRDIKPANLFLARELDGTTTLKVLDFGIAKCRDVATLGTAAGWGSPPFVAPEQLRRGKVDARADVYALAAVLVFLLTGRPPFEARDVVELALRVHHDPPASPRSRRPEVPAALEAIVLACLAKSPDDRPSSVAALAEALAPFGRGRVGGGARPRRARVVGAGVAAGLVLAAALLVRAAPADAPPPPPRAAIAPPREPAVPAPADVRAPPAPVSPRPRPDPRSPRPRPTPTIAERASIARAATTPPPAPSPGTEVPSAPEPPDPARAARCATDDFMCQFGGRAR